MARFSRFSSRFVLIVVGLLLVTVGFIEWLSMYMSLPTKYPTTVWDLGGTTSDLIMEKSKQDSIKRNASSVNERKTDEELLLQELTQTLRSAHYAFNYPSVMYLSRRTQITLTLATEEEEAIKVLRSKFENVIEGKARSGSTTYAPVMSATLRGKSFKIEPKAAQRKAALLSTKGPVEWTWIVEPLEFGKGKLLFLELEAIIGDPKTPGILPVTIKTFAARINVDARLFDRVLFEAQRMEPISKALTGIGGFIALIGFFGAMYRRLRRVGKRSPPKAVATEAQPGAGEDEDRQPEPVALPAEMKTDQGDEHLKNEPGQGLGQPQRG